MRFWCWKRIYVIILPSANQILRAVQHRKLRTVFLKRFTQTPGYINLLKGLNKIIQGVRKKKQQNNYPSNYVMNNPLGLRKGERKLLRTLIAVQE